MDQSKISQAEASLAYIEEDIPESALVIGVPEPSYDPENTTINMEIGPLDAYSMATAIFAQPRAGDITFAYNESALDGCPELKITTDEIHCKDGDWLNTDLSISEVTEGIHSEIKASQCFKIAVETVQDSFDDEFKEKFAPKDEEPAIEEGGGKASIGTNDAPLIGMKM